MTKSHPDRQTRALAGFVEDHREALESYADSDRETSGIAEALLERADGACGTDEEAEE